MSTEKTDAFELEEGARLNLDFGKMAKAAQQCPDVIPVAVQNVDNKEVILVAYTNKEAMERSIDTRIATFWSTSRNELWIKGKGSGNHFKLIDVRVNCEQNSPVYLVRPHGQGICHTKNKNGIARNCFYRRLNMVKMLLENLDP